MENESIVKVKEIYTLEKHLENLSLKTESGKILNAIWDLNKKNLCAGLNMVETYFPHYSRHDYTHSLKLINNIQRFLGEARILTLGATDTFLLLLSALTHDIGMILTYDLIEGKWSSEEMQKNLQSLSQNSDIVVANAAKYILSFNSDEIKKSTNYKWAIELKDSVTILTAELFRSSHSTRSAEYLSCDDKFADLADSFYANQLPRRFMDLLSKVAYLHGVDDKNKIITELRKEADGYCGDYIHPRFIACMIRLGDLLDFDSDRFNVFSIASLKIMPENSQVHQAKHSSVKHMLISPQSIEAELDCPSEDVYRTARTWFDWLEDEVAFQSKEWANIAPQTLGGLPPMISKGNIKILYKGINPSNPKLLDLRFTMSQKKIFDILRGGGIYKEPGVVFLREIIQNALDASKIQLWLDIQNGYYDYISDFDKNNINFPTDIPKTIYNQYPVKVSIDWKDSSKQQLHIECEDVGTGISEDNLLRMTSQVGNTHLDDCLYHQRYVSMPYWLRPTAAFGIGLQSIFFVTSSFEVETNYVGETSKRIIFRPAMEGQYCSIDEYNTKSKRGTIVKLDIDSSRFQELSGSSISFQVIRNMQEGDEVYLTKLVCYIGETFQRLQNMPLQVAIERDQWLIGNEPDENEYTETLFHNKNFNIQSKSNKGIISFIIKEKEFGSTLSLAFNDEWRINCYQNQLQLRGVQISSANLDIWMLRYMGIIWDLQNQDSDQVVNISRDSLTPQGARFIRTKLIDVILPQVLPKLKSYFEKYFKKRDNNSSIYIQYFNYCLIRYIFEGKSCLENLLSCSKSTWKIPCHVASKNNEEVSYKDFFNAKTLIVVSDNDSHVFYRDKQKEIDELHKKISYAYSSNIVVWDERYLQYALWDNYLCVNIKNDAKNVKIYELHQIENRDSSTANLVEYENIKHFYQSINQAPAFECSRHIVYGVEKYKTLVVHTKRLSGFETIPAYTNCCIYSPFKDEKQIKTLREQYNIDGASFKDYLNQHIDEYVTPILMEFIQKNNINEHVDAEAIRNTYIQLIVDIVESLAEKD